MKYFIGVDAGGTKTSAIAYDQSQNKIDQVIKGPGNLSVNWNDAYHNIKLSIDDVIEKQNSNELAGIAIGIAGLPANKQADLVEQFKLIYSVPVVIQSDYILAYRSIFGNDDGILLVGGTGVVIYGENGTKSLKMGGWGHLLGDEGSGYDIVIRTIRSSIDVYESSGKVPVVMRELLDRLEMVDLESIKTFIYHNEKSVIANLAPIVIKSANNEDSFSKSIIYEVAEVLLEKVVNLITRLEIEGKIKLAMMGGILTHTSLITDYILMKLKNNGVDIEMIKEIEPNQAVHFYFNPLNEQDGSYQYAVGLMSGTSLDGIDTVLCRIKGVDEETKVDVVDFKTYSYNPTTLERVKYMVSGDLIHVSQLSSLNFELGYEYASCVKKICQENKIATEQLAYIASHGQTIFHEAAGDEEVYRSTMQLGEPSVIAYQTQAMVVSNFREKDMAARGEGAPLVPFSEYILYQDDKAKVLLNIGGIGNLTYIPKEGELSGLFGFDVGPGNMMINEAVNYFYDLDYDDRGSIANKGTLINPLLDELMSHWFITKEPPKSSGRDEFGRDYTIRTIEKYQDAKPEDIIHTLTAFTAHTVHKHINDLLLAEYKVEQLIISGGGVHNLTLITMLKKLLTEQSIEVLTQEELGFSSDAKEAIAFVILANQTINKKPANVPSVTGAEKPVILGSITYPE